MVILDLTIGADLTRVTFSLLVGVHGMVIPYNLQVCHALCYLRLSRNTVTFQTTAFVAFSHEWKIYGTDIRTVTLRKIYVNYGSVTLQFRYVTVTVTL